MEEKLIFPYPFSNEISENINGNLGGEFVLSERGKLLQSSIRFSDFARDIIESYEDFMMRFIPQRLKIPFKRTSKYEFFFKDPIITPLASLGTGVVMSPDYARKNDRNYEASLTVSLVKKTISTGEETVVDGIKMGNIPIMIGSYLDIGKSDRCDDAQGYFIILGKEYVVMLQQQLRVHQMISVVPHKTNGEGVSTTVRCLTIDGSLYVKLNSQKGKEIFVFLDTIKESGADSILRLNVIHVMRIVMPSKFRSNHDVMKYIIEEIAPEELRSLVANYLGPSEDAFFDIGKYTIGISFSNLRNAIIHQLFPHITTASLFVDPNNTEAVLQSKIITFSVMIIHHIRVMNDPSLLDNRDGWATSQMTSPGMTLSTYFNYLYNKQMENIVKKIETIPTKTRKGKTSSLSSNNEEIYEDEQILEKMKMFIQPFLTKSIQKGFRKNSFAYRNGKNQENATQILNRKTMLSAKTHINRIVVRSLTKGKIIDKRMIHTSQTGYVCVVYSPEGDKCGLVKSKAITARISKYTPIDEVFDHIKQYLVSGNSQKRPPNFRPIMINFSFVGWGDIFIVHKRVVQGRRLGILAPTVAVVRDQLFLSIMTTGERPTRPLLVVENGKLLIDEKKLWGRSFQELLDAGVVEYVDALELIKGRVATMVSEIKEDQERRLQVAVFIEDFIKNNPKPENNSEFQMANIKYSLDHYSHCELDPTAILGIEASIIPLSQNNQGPRNTYMCNMASQALGTYTARQSERFDTEAKFLAFPTRPHMETNTATSIGLSKYPSGQNVLLAILSYTGFNQEDAIILNQRSVDNDLFTTLIFKSVVLTLSGGTNSEIAGNPKKYLKNRIYGDHVYRKLQDNGTPYLGAQIEPGDCIIGAVSNTIVGGEVIVTDISIYANMDQHGIVDAVHIGTNSQAETVIKVRLRRFKKIAVGDKIASRSAQKSTIGAILPYDEMPYTAEGIRPDLIMNPNAIPSRMTVAQLLEMVASTGTVVASGAVVNGTNWSGFGYEEFSRTLESKGWDPLLNTILYDPKTKEPLQGKVFMGICSYQVLPHQAEYKIQHRGIGAVMQTTRQAVAGRSRKGGIKVGNMEVNALMAYGAVKTANERLCSAGGTHRTIICDRCGTTISNTIISGSGADYRCTACGDDGNVSACLIKPAARFFEHVLAGAGIQIRRRLGEPVN